MALPREIRTIYAGFNVDVSLNNLSGFSFALQEQEKLVNQYSTILEGGTPWSDQLFQDIINAIKTDVQYNVSDLFPPSEVLNNPPYPNWLKILYQVVTRLNQNFELSATGLGYQDGMTFYQLFELLFQTPVQLVSSSGND